MVRSGVVERSCAEEPVEPESRRTARLLEQVDLPARRASLTLASGRRLEVEARETHDHLIVHGTDGRVVLQVELTDSGPRLMFEGASVELHATRRIAITADEVAIEAKSALSLSTGGSLESVVGGHRHTRVAGEDRLEASAVGIQSNSAGVMVRAMKEITLDGEHIGLNDDPCPQPFAWSTLADQGKEHD